MEEEYNLTPVNHKPNKRYKKVSKYDRIINSFMISRNEISEIEIKGNVSYIREQINRRIKKRKLEKKIAVNVINSKLYISIKPDLKS